MDSGDGVKGTPDFGRAGVKGPNWLLARRSDTG